MALLRITRKEVDELYDSVQLIKVTANSELARISNACIRYEKSDEQIQGLVQNSSEGNASIDAASKEAALALQEIRKNLETSKQIQAQFSSFADSLDQLKLRIDSEENRMSSNSIKADELKQVIEGLLPGATSAGLASAFRERKESIKWTIWLWAGVFASSMVTLLIVSLLNPINITSSSSPLSATYEYLLARLPYLVPLVWLAVYSSVRHSQALRLEEEYAHKEVISKSFEGYKTQLSEIEADTTKSPATELLFREAIEAIALHPGRVYELKNENVSPMSIFKDMIPSKNKES